MGACASEWCDRGRECACGAERGVQILSNSMRWDDKVGTGREEERIYMADIVQVVGKKRDTERKEGGGGEREEPCLVGR